MASIRCALVVLAATVCHALHSSELTLNNGEVTAVLGAEGLRYLGGTGHRGVNFTGDSWEVMTELRILSPEVCTEEGVEMFGKLAVVYSYSCGLGMGVEVRYSLPSGTDDDTYGNVARFVEKSITVLGWGRYEVVSVSVWRSLQMEAGEWVLSPNTYYPQLHVAGFVRWGKYGMYATVRNPWGSLVYVNGTLTVGYEVAMNATGKHECTAGLLGLTTLKGYNVPESKLDIGEREGFVQGVRHFLLDRAARAKGTVKVNVAWDENDYQIDVGTAEGWKEYTRIVDRNAELGIDNIVFAPRNTRHSSRLNTTDGWGWEMVLWFGMGELLREGRWDPRFDPIPEDIAEYVGYARAKGVRLLAYVYPCLPFKSMEKYFVSKPDAFGQVLNLAYEEVQDWLIEVLSAFVEKSGAGGFAWDHDIFAGPTSLRYAQWRGWMRILAALRTRFPDIVMDHRQTAHLWGPWYHYAGSYTEPLAGDENPETYGVVIQSLHTDHVSADQLRSVNYRYLTQLIPPERIPGFISHQTERHTAQGDLVCSKTNECYGLYRRDFDILGYRYSMISNMATAGLNNVFCMLPARDVLEYQLFPKEDRNFIRRWLAWTDANQKYLQNYGAISTMGLPSEVAVDGTHAMHGDEGYIFLFNPGLASRTATITVDQSIGISPASSSAEWEVVELYPFPNGTTLRWKYADVVTVGMPGSSARVFELRKVATGRAQVKVYGELSYESLEADGDVVELSGVQGVMGSTVSVRVVGSTGRLRVNGVSCYGKEITFAGPPIGVVPVNSSAPARVAGGWYNTTFSIPQEYFAQLEKRGQEYPMPWGAEDYAATWLVPTRLLMYVYVPGIKDNEPITMYLNSHSAPLTSAYNSRGLKEPSVFLGYYFDASDLEPDVTYRLAVRIPEQRIDAFQGVFWQNLLPERTSKVMRC